MLAAVEAALPADVFIAVAAVADWRPEVTSPDKLKKGSAHPVLSLVETPDILATIAARDVGRPALVVGFAAETRDLLDHARAKLGRKGCDMILANDVGGESSVMGRDVNEVTLLTAGGQESWPRMSKDEVARKLVARLAAMLDGRGNER
jgi:phosphopantothenoylcysteine decarboxylase/phosphopantothenate--cysteine ligase